MAIISIRRANLLPFLLLAALSSAVIAEQPSYVPAKGFVSDEKTAIAIAEAIFVPIYGGKQIVSERPFHAVLNSEGIWTLSGSLSDGWEGGVAIVRISRQDGRVLFVMHGK